MRRLLSVCLTLTCAAAATACSPPSDDADAGDPVDTGSAPDTSAMVDGADGSETTSPDSDATDTGAPSTPLVTNTAWERVEASGDPWSSHRPDSVDCPQTAVDNEQLQGEQTLSINTERCNYFSVRQQTLADIDSGDTLEVRVWHFELTHDESAEAHVALALDGDVVWETSVPLPTDSGALLSKTWTANNDYPAGTRVDFHLHNHGSNNWNFIEFSKAD